MNELQAASENPEWKLEEELKKHWPSAVEGDFEHPEKGTIHYWAGEQRGKIVVRFTYPQQPVEDQNKVFFIDAGTEGWVLRHVSEFQNLDAELKLVKNQSFRILDELNQRYRGIIDEFMKIRDGWSHFCCLLYTSDAATNREV